jgi:hypothetical protein
VHEWLVTTEVVRHGYHRTCHIVWARSKGAAQTEARTRESQAWAGNVEVSIVSVEQVR